MDGDVKIILLYNDLWILKIHIMTDKYSSDSNIGAIIKVNLNFLEYSVQQI